LPAARKCNWPTLKSRHGYKSQGFKKYKCQKQTLGDAEACCSMLELRKQESISCSPATSLLTRARLCCLRRKYVRVCGGT